MATTTTTAPPTAPTLHLPSRKQQLHDQNPKRIKALRFSLSSPQDVVAQAVVEITNRNLYDVEPSHPSRLAGGGGKTLTRHGPLDPRLGTSNNAAKCETCGQQLKNCNGHFGHVRLALPVFHVGYIKNILEVLHCICKECSRVLMDEEKQLMFRVRIGGREMDSNQREAHVKKVVAECKKVKKCQVCGAVNGSIKKVAGHALKLIHDKFSSYHRSLAKSKVAPEALKVFEASFEEVKTTSTEVEKHLRKAVDDMNPLRVLELFSKVRDQDCELLGLGKGARPEMLIWQYIPAPPVSIRPSVQQDTASTEDDITNKLGDIINMSLLLETGIESGQRVEVLMEQWDFLQLQVAMYINSDLPNITQAGHKKMRSFCQRLKGKQGRFRGNLSGKRVDFSGRTVISPDPNLGVDEVAVPKRVAENMTYPETVTRQNREKLMRLVRRGTKYPGANFVHKKETGRKIVLAVLGRNNNQAKLDLEAERLKIGDVVDRHLEDGDVVLFNRQPSLHKLSIMCHRVQVREHRTFRLNECVCTPYNADFDGDEMNLHVPQTEEARAEALELMGVKHNLATPKDGTPIIAATQDFITCTYLLSNKDRFFDRKSFAQICAYMFDANVVMDGVAKVYNPQASSILKDRNGMSIDMPEPTILKPEALWTGKQVFSVLMKPSKKSNVLVNFDAKCKEYKEDPNNPLDRNADDNYVCVRNSEIMCGQMDKAILGTGKKDSIFYVMMRDYGPEYAVQAMNRMAKLSARWLSNQGFSIGYTDVKAGAMLKAQKEKLVADAYEECDNIIDAFGNSRLSRDAGCNEEQTMENKITGQLNAVRGNAGKLCFEQLSKRNAAVIMAKSGSKGSNLNVAQMVAVVGQQTIGQARVADGFQDRTLPHFPKAARQPASKGFVSNSFFTGLTPTEFIFHAMSGREGLVDTAVKTAETGYMSRRLVKSLEDLSVSYDDSVRNSSSSIVQFQYGDDRLDPVDMEGKAKPVDLNRTFNHAQSSQWDDEPGLKPAEIEVMAKRLLEPERAKLQRTSLLGEKLEYNVGKENLFDVDEFESNRDFLSEVEDFLKQKAARLAHFRQHLGLDPGWVEKKRGRKKIDEQEGIVSESSMKLSARTLETFVTLCLTKYHRSKVQPGHAVGCVGAQSIGEPGTQMTLRTFHFAGVSGMSITQGVPRIKEIINASRLISTPVISCQLLNPTSEPAARLVKAQIEKTFLRDVIDWISECWTENKCYLRVCVNFDTIHELQLQVSMTDICDAIRKLRGWKLQAQDLQISSKYIHVYLPLLPEKDEKPKASTTSTRPDLNAEPFLRMQALKRALPSVIIKGYPGTTRAVIARKNGTVENELLIEGYGLKSVLTTPGIAPYKTKTNNILETYAVLGIEAARHTIISELYTVMGAQMDIDPRHTSLLADVMTCRGDVLGITRFGLQKMRDSVLQLASFEKTADHLFEAAVRGKEDGVRGVSECVIMGQSVRLGTGSMGVIREMGWREGDFARREGGFEAAWGQYGA